MTEASVAVVADDLEAGEAGEADEAGVEAAAEVDAEQSID